MATTNIELDIENITGVSDADDQFIVSAQKFVTASVPSDLLRWAGKDTVVGTHGGDSSPTLISLPYASDHILDVSRNGFSAREVPETMKGFIANSSSLHLATETYPKYYLTAGNGIVVKPDPSDSETAIVNYIDPDNIDDDSDLRNAVIFHASSKEFEQLSTGKITDWSDLSLPVAPSSPSFGSDLSISSVLPAPPSAPSFDVGAISVSSSAPTYSKPLISLGSAPTISDLSISAVAPSTPTSPSFSTPTVSTSTVSNIGSPPAYTKPTITARVSFEDFYNLSEDGNPFGDNDPGSFSGLASPPDSPSSPSISSPGISTVAKPDAVGSSPSYTKPTVTSQTSFASYWTVGDFGDSDPGPFGLVASPPTTPSAPAFSTPAVSAVTIGALPGAPNYTAPVVGGDAAELSSLDDLDTNNTIDEHTDQPEWDQWFATAGHLIEDEEDTELAAIQIQKINAYISAYSQSMQNQLNIFNEGNAVYQASIQRNIEQARINAQDAQQEANLKLQEENQQYAATLQKYQADVSKYQAEVAKEVQEYTQKLSRYQLELNTVFQAWQKTESDNLQIFNSDIQNELNEFNKESAIYQANIQAEIAKHQTDAQEAQKEGDLTFQASIQDYSLELQKFSSDVSKYQAEVNDYIQEYSQKLSRYTMEVDKAYTAWAKTESDSFQQYQLDIQNELNEFNKENAEYQGKLQEAIQQSQLDSQKAQQDASLKLQKENQEYSASLQRFSSEVQVYQANVAKEVQQYQQNLEGDLNVWQLERQTDLQKYASDLQNELNEFNKEQTVFQNELQEKVQEATNQQTKDSAEYGAKLQKYGNEIQSYQADVNKEVQDFVNTLQKEMQEYQSKLALYNADLQKYQAQIGEKTQKVTSATQNAAYYSNESKKYYEWAVAEVNMYIQNNSKMINRTIAAQAAQR